MSNKISILAFGGSLRKGSYTKAILYDLKRLAEENVEIEVFDIRDVPFFNQDLEAEMPESVRRFKEKVREADAVIVVTPEYNYSIPGFLKNAIDWLGRPPGDNSLDEKPVAIISASSGMIGGARAQYHLRQVLVYLNAHPINEPEVMIPFVQEKINDGTVADKETEERIRKLIKALVEWAERIKVK